MSHAFRADRSLSVKIICMAYIDVAGREPDGLNDPMIY